MGEHLMKLLVLKNLIRIPYQTGADAYRFSHILQESVLIFRASVR